MNYDKLKEEIAKEEYKGLSDSQIAALLNRATITAVRNVPTTEIATWAAENGLMAMLWAAERAPETPAPLYGAIKTLLTVLDRLNEWRILDAGGHLTPAAMQMVGGLIQAGIMTQEQADELAAMATTTTSWAALNWPGEIAYWDVARARGGDGE